MANEVGIAEGFLAARLQANSTLMSDITDYYSGIAPRETPGLYVVWSYQGAIDDEMFNNVRIATTVTFLVEVIGPTTFKNLEAAADQVDDSLHRASGTYNGHRIAAVVRTSPHATVEPMFEQEWRHLGGYYDFYVVAG